MPQQPIRVRPGEPPGGWRAPRYAGATLLDSFTVQLPAGAPDDAYDLARLALIDPPAFFKALMGLRDAIMARFGVRTSREIASTPDGLDRIDFFPVLGRSRHEVEIGAQDRHVDFRTWLTIEGSGDKRRFTSTTAATAHNVLGRCYLRVIRPFHVAIVKAGLRRLVRRL